MSDTWDDGETGLIGLPDTNSPLSLDYYRQKVVAFQNVITSLDSVYYELQSVGSLIGDDPDAYAEWSALVGEFEDKRNQIGVIAEGLNLASQGMNGSGISFPSVVNTMGLGIGPVVIPAALAAAVAAAVYMMAWATGFLDRLVNAVNHWKSINAIAALPVDQQGPALAQLEQLSAATDQALAASRANQLTAFSTLVKYGAIALGIYFAWKLYKDAQ